MTKATHNGTCQACGRKQALRGTMAKHGYTVDYGYFSGTCSGSDRQPLELATAHNEDVVAGVRNWADEQDALANGNISTVPFQVDDPDAASRFAQKTIHVTRDEYIQNNVADWHADSPETDWNEFNGEKWDKKADNVRFQLRNAAKHARKDADQLEALRATTFGNELESREIPEAQRPQKETGFQNYREAYARSVELKELGFIKIRVNGGCGSRRELSVTYRGA